MGLSRQEAAFRRLLARCEMLYKTPPFDPELFPKYMDTLEEMLTELRKKREVTIETAGAYQRRINSLKSIAGMPLKETEISDSSVENINQMDAQMQRDELLRVRQRNVAAQAAGTAAQGGDLDQIINYHDNMQLKVTDNILNLTKSLKHQSELANKIIRKDTEIVGKSMILTEQNYTKLSSESNKLQEHSKRACRCWMWGMLLFVLVVFINMVLFMKVIKKN